jgi:hypothetical protein
MSQSDWLDSELRNSLLRRGWINAFVLDFAERQKLDSGHGKLAVKPLPSTNFWSADEPHNE